MDIIVEVEKKVLVNIDGGRGPQGTQGIDGENGLSAYEIALENGFIGTESEWLASLQGADGDPATNLVTSVAGRQGVVVLTKADVALSNVDNTSDVNKPISTDTQTALNLKVDKVAGERLINAAEITKLGNQSGVNTGDQNDHGLMIGLLDDDHTQYMLLSGRVGGQTLNGNLNMTDRLSFGTASGTGRINLPDGGTTSADGIWFGTAGSIFRNAVLQLTTDAQIFNFTNGGRTFQVRPSNAGGLAGTLLLTSSGVLALGSTGSWGTYIDSNQNLVLGNIGGSSIGNARLDVRGETLTGSSATSALSISQTWNTTGNPTAFLMNITNTASGASANLMDLQIGGVSQFRVSKAGLTSSVPGGLAINYATGGGSINGGTNGRFSITHNFGFAIYNISNPINTGITIGANADPNARAILDVRSTTKGILFPNMTTTQRNAIATVAGDAGLTIFNTTTTKLEVWDGTTWQAAW